MARLYRILKLPDQSEKAELILPELLIAESFWSRMKGLLGKKELSSTQALWIRPCNNIHTFFMKFTIDCIFVNRSNVIQKIYPRVGPFRIAGPVWKANSVLEFPEGTAEKWNLKIGDQLHVVN